MVGSFCVRLPLPVPDLLKGDDARPEMAQVLREEAARSVEVLSCGIIKGSGEIHRGRWNKSLKILKVKIGGGGGGIAPSAK